MGWNHAQQKWTKCTAGNPAMCANHIIHQGGKTGLTPIAELPKNAQGAYDLKYNTNTTEAIIERFRRHHNLEELNGLQTYQPYDSFNHMASSAVYNPSRPENPAQAEMFDTLRNMLDESTNIIIGNIRPNKKNSNTGTFTFGTSYKDDEGIMDRTQYYYSKDAEGNITLYRKTLFKTIQINKTELLQDIAAARNKFNNIVGQRGGM